MVKNKLKMDIPDSQHPFIPPISELIGWLGGPTGLHTIFHKIMDEQGLQKPDLKTLRRACQDGVTPRIANIIESHLNTIIKKNKLENLVKEYKPKEPVVTGTNGMKWCVFARSLLKGINEKQPIPIELPSTFTFLERRPKGERDLMLAMHGIRRTSGSMDSRLDRLNTTVKRICRSQTLLTSQEIQSYSAVVIEANRQEKSNPEKLIIEAAKYTFILRLDFYHQLLTRFMVDMLAIREQLGLPLALNDALLNNGAMGQLVPVLERGKLITPTQRIYEFWRNTFLGPDEQPISYRKMAMNIPKPELARTRIKQNPGQESSTDARQQAEEAADATRLTLLKQWRNGTTPNSLHLTKFLESLGGEDYDAFLPFIMTRVATAWTKWIEQERAHLEGLTNEAPFLKDHVDLGWLVGKFATYPKYWHHAMTQVAIS